MTHTDKAKELVEKNYLSDSSAEEIENIAQALRQVENETIELCATQADCMKEYETQGTAKGHQIHAYRHDVASAIRLLSKEESK